ncbi:hypothetical protein [Saccharopolyspora sp. NPDC003762]
MTYDRPRSWWANVVPTWSACLYCLSCVALRRAALISLVGLTFGERRRGWFTW